MNPPDPDFERTLAAAQGFFQLEMWNDAWAELEELAPEFRHLSQVIILRVLILNNLGKSRRCADGSPGAIVRGVCASRGESVGRGVFVRRSCPRPKSGR